MIFADDTTATITDADPSTLSEKKSVMYDDIASYLTNNRLVVNDTKTHIMVMSLNQRKRKTDQAVTIKTPSKEIEVSTSQRLLEINIHESLKFRDHIMVEEKSMVQKLNVRIKALKNIRNIASFKDRLIVANGLFMSCLVYGIQLWMWGGTEEYLRRCLQVLQNRAAKAVTGLGHFTPAKDLMRQTGWLSVKQLIFYHSVVMVKRVKESGRPGIWWTG